MYNSKQFLSLSKFFKLKVKGEKEMSGITTDQITTSKALFLENLIGALRTVNLDKVPEKDIDKMIKEYVPERIPDPLRIIKGNYFLKKIIVLVDMGQKTYDAQTSLNILAAFEWLVDEITGLNKK